VPHAAARKIVEDAHLNAWLIQETLGEIRANETCATGDQNGTRNSVH
jgi:hypothetical protein